MARESRRACEAQPAVPPRSARCAGKGKGKTFLGRTGNVRSPLLLLLLLKLPLELLRDVGGLGPHGGCGHSTRADARVRGGGEGWTEASEVQKLRRAFRGGTHP